jgi:hypothetical protein
MIMLLWITKIKLRTNGIWGHVRYTGVLCWNSDEDRVLSLNLNNLGLEGRFPQGLEYCTSLVSLDLSINNLSGPIPPDVSSLDLSYNNFSGECHWRASFFSFVWLCASRYTDIRSISKKLYQLDATILKLVKLPLSKKQNFQVSSHLASQMCYTLPSAQPIQWSSSWAIQ